MHVAPPLPTNTAESSTATTLPGDERSSPPIDLPSWLSAVVQETIRAAASRSHLRWISASVGANVRMIHVDDVLFFRADTKYTRVVTADVEVLIRKSLRELRGELDPEIWWPIHRSTIVNVHAISDLTRDMNGKLVVRLKRRADKLSVSDVHAYQFRQM